MMKYLILIAIFASTTFIACKTQPKSENKTQENPAESFQKETNPFQEINPFKDSVMKIVIFLTEEKNKDAFASWKRLPSSQKGDSLFVDFVGELRTPSKSYEIIIESWSESIQIKGKDTNSADSYFIADSGPDGKLESGFWDGYMKGDKREKAYIGGIFAYSDETQICCEYREYWQEKYHSAVKDIYTQLKLD